LTASFTEALPAVTNGFTRRTDPFLYPAVIGRDDGKYIQGRMLKN
jgi:hypothetical protein